MPMRIDRQGGKYTYKLASKNRKQTYPVRIVVHARRRKKLESIKSSCWIQVTLSTIVCGQNRKRYKVLMTHRRVIPNESKLENKFPESICHQAGPVVNLLVQ